MRSAAKKRGIEITSISRPIRPTDFKDFDLILAMDKQNRGNKFEPLALGDPATCSSELLHVFSNYIFYAIENACRGHIGGFRKVESQGFPSCRCRK